MTDLPKGWIKVSLGELCLPVDKIEPTDLGRDSFRYIDIGSIDPDRQEIGEVCTISSANAPTRARQLTREGDTLFSTVRPYLRKIAAVPAALDGEIASTGFCVIRPVRQVDPRYVYYLTISQEFLAEVVPKQRGVSYPAVRDSDIFGVSVPLPPLAEQRRIVAALEEHLSHLNAATAGVATVSARLRTLAKRIIVDSVPIPCPSHWKLVKVADAGRVNLGRQRHPNWHTGQNMRPYLRVANVFEDRIDTSDLMEMDFPPDVFEKYRLSTGDILLNEGQSPEYLGRPAMYRGNPKDVAFTNSLLRFRAGPDVSPEWALLVFRRHMHARRFIREVRITTNIAHLSAGRLKSIEFPIPPREEQNRIVAEVKARLEAVEQLSAVVNDCTLRSANLRRSLLKTAFSGQLVAQDPDDEPAEKLLERIRAERAAQPKVRRRRRVVTSANVPGQGRLI